MLGPQDNAEKQGEEGTSALIASQTAHPSSSELLELFLLQQLTENMLEFTVTFSLLGHVNSTYTDGASQVGDPAGRSPAGMGLVGVWIHPHQSPAALILSLLCCGIWPLGRRTPSLFVGSQPFHKERTCKLGLTSHSTKAGSQLTSYPWNTPQRCGPQSLLSGSLRPPARCWPHRTPPASAPAAEGTRDSSQLTPDMCLTTLSFQNSQAKPSANKAMAGPPPASLIEICLLQNV